MLSVTRLSSAPFLLHFLPNNHLSWLGYKKALKIFKTISCKTGQHKYWMPHYHCTDIFLKVPSVFCILLWWFCIFVCFNYCVTLSNSQHVVLFCCICGRFKRWQICKFNLICVRYVLAPIFLEMSLIFVGNLCRPVIRCPVFICYSQVDNFGITLHDTY